MIRRVLVLIVVVGVIVAVWMSLRTRGDPRQGAGIPTEQPDPVPPALSSAPRGAPPGESQEESGRRGWDDIGPREDAGPWGEPIVVRVLSATDDAPVQGALVRVRYKPDEAPTGKDSPRAQEGVSDADGRARVIAPAQRYGVTWMVRRRGFRTAFPEIDTRGAERIVRLRPGTPLEVRVVDAETEAVVEGARVRARCVDSPWDPIDEEATTDPRGRMVLAGVAPNAPIEIAVVMEGTATVVRTYTPTRDADQTVEVALGAGAQINGTVHDAQGEPVAAADVYVAQAGAMTPLHPTDRADEDEIVFRRTHARSDASGRFRVRGVPAPGTYIVYARGPGGAEGMSTPVQVEGEGARLEADVMVRASGTVVLRYVDARSHDAIAPSDVRASLDADWGDQRPDQVPTDDSRTMQATLLAVAPGRHVLHVDASDHLARELAFELSPGQRLEQTVLLEPGRTVTGRTVDREGRPVEAYVSFEASYGGIDQVPNARSDENGRFTLHAVPPVAGTLAAWEDGVGRSSWPGVEPRGEVGDLVVGEGSTRVTGVLAAALRKRSLAGGVMSRGGGGWSGRVSVDEGGRFHLLLPPGSGPFDVYLVPEDAPDLAPLVVRGLTPEAGKDVELGTVRFPPGALLEGVVSTYDGAPARGVLVRLVEFWGPGSVRTDETGSFRLGPLPPGRSTLWVESDRLAVHFRTVDIGDRDSRVRIRLPQPGTLRVRVVDTAQRPVPGVHVNVYSVLDTGVADWSRRVIVRTDGQGRADVSLPPGHFGAGIHPNTGREMAGQPPVFDVTAGSLVSVDVVIR